MNESTPKKGRKSLPTASKKTQVKAYLRPGEVAAVVALAESKGISVSQFIEGAIQAEIYRTVTGVSPPEFGNSRNPSTGKSALVALKSERKPIERKTMKTK